MTSTAAQVIEALGLPRGLPLSRDTLARVAAAVAARPAAWVPHVDLNATERTYVSLHRDSDVDVWAIAWLPDNDTGWHDHDTSSGAVHVIEGVLTEHALLVGGPDRRRTHSAGTSFSFGPSQIHRLTCAVPRAISIHAYSPPLWRLGQYTTDADGILHRLSVSYADELRPLAAEVAA
jgi:Cysteine dioxygenase type I